jgi:hypothetical protein
MRIDGMVGRAVFGAAVAFSLGVGATTALAAPREAARQYTCTPKSCSEECELMGFNFRLCRWVNGAYYCECSNRAA